MKSITQKAKYKQSVIKYSLKYGVSKASRKFNEHRKTIYRWRERYDGTLKSLEDKSRKPHYHPKQHTQEEMDFWDVRKWIFGTYEKICLMKLVKLLGRKIA